MTITTSPDGGGASGGAGAGLGLQATNDAKTIKVRIVKAEKFLFIFNLLSENYLSLARRQKRAFANLSPQSIQR